MTKTDEMSILIVIVIVILSLSVLLWNRKKGGEK